MRSSTIHLTDDLVTTTKGNILIPGFVLPYLFYSRPIERDTDKAENHINSGYFMLDSVVKDIISKKGYKYWSSNKNKIEEYILDCLTVDKNKVQSSKDIKAELTVKYPFLYVKLHHIKPEKYIRSIQAYYMGSNTN